MPGTSLLPFLRKSRNRASLVRCTPGVAAPPGAPPKPRRTRLRVRRTAGTSRGVAGGVMPARLRDSFVTPPAAFSPAFLSAEPVPSSGQSRSPAPAALQPLGFAPSLPPHRSSARHPQPLRWRDVWRESERRPSTGGWVPGAFPDGETARVPWQPITARVPCKIPSSSSVNCVFSRFVFHHPYATI